MKFMKTTEKNLIPTRLLADLQEAADRVATGIRDPEAMKKAARDMDRMREETRKELGIIEVAVDLIRESRDEK